MIRKRAPGGGRKPKGEIKGKDAAFSTRITAQTRRALEETAKRHGRSVSQEAEIALRTYLSKPAGESRNRALAFIIGHLAEGIEATTGKSWRDDVFTGVALHFAIEMAMTYLVPERVPDPEVPQRVLDLVQKMPPDIAQQYTNAGRLGALRGLNLMTEIESVTPVGSTVNEIDLPISMNKISLDVLALLASDLKIGKDKR